MRPSATDSQPDLHPIVLWRTSCLVEAGFSTQLADTLGRNRAFDLPALMTSWTAGCPTVLAARILVPLDQ
jgi:hypothetical protein